MAKEKYKALSSDELNKHSDNLKKDFAKFEIMKQEFEGLREAKEKDFLSKLPELLTDEERDAIEVGGDPIQTYQILKKHEKAFVDDAVAEQEQILEAFENELHTKQGQLDLLSVETAFMEQNPDADFGSMIEFMQMKLSKDELNQLNEQADGDHVKFLGLVNEKFAGKAKGDKAGKELPTDLSSVAGASGDVDDGDGGSSEDDSYARQAGLYS